MARLGVNAHTGERVLPATFLASAGRVIWRMAEGHGVDPEALFKAAGLDPRVIDQPRARYAFKKICRAWEQLADTTGKPHLGLEAGEYYRVTDLHAMGVTFLASSNLLEALVRLDRYETVLNSTVDFDIKHLPGRIEFVCVDSAVPPSAARIVEDMRNTILLDLARRGVNRDVQPLQLSVTYPEPIEKAPYAQAFRCPIKFAQQHSYLAFSEADTNTPFTARNVDLAFESDKILDGLLQSLEESDLVSRVRQVIAEALPSGAPSEANVAQKLLTSPRTLHRRLAENGTSYRQLLNDVRLNLAKAYLEKTPYPITEISYLVGFSDLSAFSRAFKRWTGVSPMTYRS